MKRHLVALAMCLSPLTIAAIALPSLALAQLGEPCEEGHDTRRVKEMPLPGGGKKVITHQWKWLEIGTKGNARRLCNGTGGEYTDARDVQKVDLTGLGIPVALNGLVTGGAEICTWTFPLQPGEAFANPQGGWWKVHSKSRGDCSVPDVKRGEDLVVTCAIQPKTLFGRGSWAKICGKITKKRIQRSGRESVSRSSFGRR